ncbi:hypothetical protein ABT297_04190 [Dactylosporangium sp. NPDC000555]|uniref:hypothetical protein n=1 Tax=Dactylosporangium sp. NPDC000555 TaxID=3154260 RepID=UPI003330BC6C
MSAFERYAVQLLIDQANAAGVDVPDTINKIASSLANADHCGSYPARTWAEQHPDEADWPVGCCIGNDLGGPDRCTCWVPVFALEQQPPRPPREPADIERQPRMCGDCAFRKGSPERADQFMEDALFDLAASGQPFWCHQDMRRPLYWRHPDGRRVEGSTADWQPPFVAGVPYRADGRPGLLCAGWLARAERAHRAPP